MTLPESGIVRFKDFSPSPEPITFRFAPDDFECVSVIPLDGLVQLAAIGRQINENTGPEQMKIVYEFFDLICLPDSAAKLRERCAQGSANPIGLTLITDVLPWLMEQYGLRPTQPSDESSDGSTPDDTSSTDGASLTVSTSFSSP